MLDTDDLKYNFGCACCGYKEPDERIDVGRVIDRLDALFDRNDMEGAGRLLDYWRGEAVRLGDSRGELSVVSEQMGFFRKTGDMEKGLEAVARGLELTRALKMEGYVSGATVLLNAATTMKAFGQAEEALPLYEEARSVYAENLKPDDPRFAGLWNNYALALADVGEYAAAEKAYKTAIGIMERAENGKPDAAVSYVNLAQLYSADETKTDADEAACLDRAMALLRDKDNAPNGYYYFVLSKCAPAFRAAGHTKEADEMEGQVRAYYERA